MVPAQVFIFKHRYKFLLLFIILIIILGFFLHFRGHSIDKVASITTGCFVVLTIFFSILSYEYNASKNLQDNQASRNLLTYTTSIEWYKPPLTGYTKLHYQHKKEIESFTKIGNTGGLYEYLSKEENTDLRIAITSILNYFEGISLGVSKKLIDEAFINEFFHELFITYYNKYQPYIQYRRDNIEKSQDIWKHFIKLASDWKSKI